MDVQRATHAAIACVLGLLPVAAFAAPASIPTDQPLTVTAYDTPRLTKLVSYDDLALMTSGGRELLLHRVGLAVDEICPIFDDHGDIYDMQDCRAYAWSGARQQIKQAIDLARFGSKVAMAIEVTPPRLR